MTPPAELKTPPSNISNTELIQWVFERLNENDSHSLRQLWTAETVEYFPDVTCQGPDQIAAWFEDKFAAIEGFRLNVLCITESGSDVLVHWRMTGRHTGTLVGIAATGRPIDVEGIDHFVLQDGKVASNTVIFDQLKLARQLGFMPPDASHLENAAKTAFNLKTRVRTAITRRSA
ncbi:ester cyclase [Hoyosella rhizosphaerae]|uniref:Ester cyclase n=1 Tax=Hoyosella rhizosphaerae TaxID=1755582 RepID=A0A916X9Y5_9ACTN|nr:ester cyclase [Hoyosella rhizosphaerae]MBN4926880.1 ester cyclase [Hoyosella rhizosphaerae]GGC55779.1 hypothetical protein GCM10011410_05240 [Hoyosella rhizosphaerae]